MALPLLWKFLSWGHRVQVPHIVIFFRDEASNRSRNSSFLPLAPQSIPYPPHSFPIPNTQLLCTCLVDNIHWNSFSSGNYLSPLVRSSEGDLSRIPGNGEGPLSQQGQIGAVVELVGMELRRGAWKFHWQGPKIVLAVLMLGRESQMQ